MKKFTVLSLLLLTFVVGVSDVRAAGAVLDITINNLTTNAGNVMWVWTRSGTNAPPGSDGVPAMGVRHLTDTDLTGLEVTWNLKTKWNLGTKWVNVGTFKSGPGAGAYNFTVNGVFDRDPTNCTDTVTIYNSSTQRQFYELLRNGASIGMFAEVASGATAVFTVANPGCAENGISVRVVSNVTSSHIEPGGQDVPGGHLQNGSISGTTGPETSVNSTTTLNGASTGATTAPPQTSSVPGPPIPQYTNAITGTNIPVNYTNAAAANTNLLNSGTFQQGNNALYTAVVEGSRAVVDAVNINGSKTLFALGGVTNAINSGTTTLNTNLTGIKDGVLGMSGVLTNIEENTRPLHADLTNGFAMLRDSITNRVTDTNAIGDTNLGPFNVTSAASAQAAGETAVGSVLGDINGAIDGIGTSDVGEGAGTEINATINAGGGHTFNIRPKSGAFAGLFGVIKSFWTLILCLGYAVKIGADLLKFHGVMVSARGMSLPNLTLPLLGNVGGIAAGIIALFVVLGLYAIFVGLAFSALTGVISWTALSAAITGDPTAGMDAGALNLITSIFPLSLAIGLGLAYATFRLTMFKLAVIVNAALKPIMGA